MPKQPADWAPKEFTYMRAALAQAQLAFEAQEVPIGAVAVARGRILARAHNQVERLVDATAHAEMLCITAAAGYLSSKYLTDVTLYVTLEPCVMCAGALRWAQLGRLVYAAADAKFGYSQHGAGLLHPRTQVQAGLLAQESLALLQSFFQALR